jgi:hypothetical protein
MIIFFGGGYGLNASARWTTILRLYVVDSYGIQRSIIISRGFGGNGGNLSIITERGGGGIGGRVFVKTCAN